MGNDEHPKDRNIPPEFGKFIFILFISKSFLDIIVWIPFVDF